MVRDPTIKLREGILALLVIIAGVGCATREATYSAILESRAESYRRWVEEKEAGATETKLEGKLSLEDALKLALLYNKQLQAMLQEKERARGRIVESYSEALPKVNASFNYTRLDRVASFDVAGHTVSLGDVHNYSVDLKVTQPVFRGGAISAAIRAARLYSYLADEMVRGTVQNVIYQVTKAYYDVLLAKELYQINLDAVKASEAHLRDVRFKREQGAASDFDVLRAEVELSNFRAEMIKQQNRIHLAKTSLLKIMGVSQQSEVELSDSLEYEPMKPVLEEAVRIAYENRPDLYQAHLNLKLQKEAVRIAKSAYFPKIDLFFTHEWSRPNPRDTTKIEWDKAWEAGAMINIPIFDGFRRDGRLIQEKAALRQREIDLVNTEEKTLLEIQQALLSLRDAEELVESQKMNLLRAKEGLRLAQVGYREGINTEVEVVDARAAHTRAKAYYYQAIYAHCLAKLQLQKAMGLLGPAPGEEPVRGSPPEPGKIGAFETGKRMGEKR